MALRMYDYWCEKCEETTEHLIPTNHELAKVCETCKRPLLKVVGGGGVFEFKGEGTYDKGRTARK